VSEPEPEPISEDVGDDTDAGEEEAPGIADEPPVAHPPPPAWLPDSFREAEGKDDLEKLQTAWPELVDRCRMIQPLIKQQLRDSWPVEVTETRLTVGFDPEFAEEIEVVRQFDHGALHGLFSQLLGRSVRLEYTVLDAPVTWSHLDPKAEADTDSKDEEPFSAERAGLNPQAWLRNDAVRQVLEVFHGDILKVQR